jgi:hypothetical protein
MRKLRIYLDTSIVNFLFAEDSPDFRRATEGFFAQHSHKYEALISAANQQEGHCHTLRLLSPLEVQDEY